MKTGMCGGEPVLYDGKATGGGKPFDKRLQAKQQEEQAKQMAEREAKAKTNASEGKAFLAANASKEGVTTTESGLQYQVLVERKGPKPTAEDMVKVHYTGELLDGTQFDSSHERGEPAAFALQQVAPDRTSGAWGKRG